MPVEIFIESTDIKMQARILSTIEVLREKGNLLRLPYSKYLDDGIFELRIMVGNNISRILYFFYLDRKIILTNGFVKKTQKTPRKEIMMAKKLISDYMKRKSN